MESKHQTKKAAFVCPNHGVLYGTVEYASADMGTKALVDIPVMYCQVCKKYYTPFTNLLSFVGFLDLQYKGCRVVASQGRVEKSISRETVQVPHFVDKPIPNKAPARPQSKLPTRMKGYEVVTPVGQKTEGFKLYLTNYVCEECPVCKQRLVQFIKFIQISETQALRVPVKCCTKCDLFFEEHGSALAEISKEVPLPEQYSISQEYLIPRYAKRMQTVRSIKSASIAVHLKEEGRSNHRLITIVSSREDRNNKNDVFHYTDLFARQLLLEIHRQSKSIDIAGVIFDILKVFRIGVEKDPLRRHTEIDTIVLRSGGGLYQGLFDSGTELVDILLFSPFTRCFEVAHASYDTENALYYMDAKVFRKFVMQYGNPGVRIAAYQSGLLRNFSTMKEESVLHAYGYVVGNSGVPENARQSLLGEILDLGLMSSHSILCLLELNLSTHPGEKYRNARACWEADRRFVMEYKVNPDRFVVAGIGIDASKRIAGV